MVGDGTRNLGLLGVGFYFGIWDVMELSGTKAPHPYPKEAEMFFSSVCAGCHGNDGKGLGGSYPDLTRKKLLGLKRWLRQKRE